MGRTKEPPEWMTHAGTSDRGLPSILRPGGPKGGPFTTRRPAGAECVGATVGDGRLAGPVALGGGAEPLPAHGPAGKEPQHT